jgi:hypothetical protein
MKHSNRPVHQFCALNDRVGWDRYLSGEPMRRVLSDVVLMDRREMGEAEETLPWILRRR